jgi:transposase
VHEWAAIKPMLPNKPRGVPRVRQSMGRSRGGLPNRVELDQFVFRDTAQKDSIPDSLLLRADEVIE